MLAAAASPIKKATSMPQPLSVPTTPSTVTPAMIISQPKRRAFPRRSTSFPRRSTRSNVLVRPTVDGGSVTTAGGTSSFSGSCSSALEVVLGQGPYADATAAIPAVVSDLHNAVATRCATAAGRRVAAGFVCLAGALGAVLLATLRPRRLRRRSILNHVSKVNRRAVVAGATAIVGAADKSLPPDGES